VAKTFSFESSLIFSLIHSLISSNTNSSTKLFNNLTVPMLKDLDFLSFLPTSMKFVFYFGFGLLGMYLIRFAYSEIKIIDIMIINY